ncbi:MAG: DNA-binding protein [Deltaproteobacteria bacterium]
MYITFNELRKIKHSLPTGSVKRIADELNIDEQSVRNYFGAMKYTSDEEIVGKHIQPGPDGGIVNLEDTEILDLAKKILEEANIQL